VKVNQESELQLIVKEEQKKQEQKRQDHENKMMADHFMIISQVNLLTLHLILHMIKM
jgi:hypothetical protein